MLRKLFLILVVVICRHTVVGVALPGLERQTILWTSPTNEILGRGLVHRLLAHASSGLPVQFRILSGPGAIEGEALTITNIGTVWVEAIQNGNEFYSPTNLARAFNVRRVSFPRLSRTYPPYCRYVKLHAGFAFMSDIHFGLRVFNIANPVKPVQVGAFYIGDWGTREIEIVKDVAVIAADTNGLQILNIADPSNIQRLSEVRDLGTLNSVTVKNHFAFVGPLNRPVRVFDLSELQFPKEINFDAGAYGITSAVSGEKLFLSNGGVMIYDIANPLAAVKIASYSQNIARGFYAIEGQGNLLFTGDHELFILDVEQSASPRLLSKVPIITDPGILTGLNVIDQYLYVLSDKVLVFDISNPSSPLLVGETEGRGGPYWNVEKSEGLLYVAGGNSGFEIYQHRMGLPQAVHFDLPAHIDLDDQAMELRAFATSGLDVNYELVSGPAYLDGNTLRLKSTGEILIRAIQEGNEDYLPASVELKTTIYSSRPVLQIVSSSGGLRLSWPVSEPEFLL